MSKKASKNKKASQIPAALFAFSSLLFLSVAVTFFYLLHIGDLLPGPANASTGYISWRIFNGGGDDQGANYSESALNTSNVPNLKVLWKASTPAAADDSVVEEAAVSTSSGLQNMVFVDTIKGNLVAYNALTGTKIWERDPSSANFNGQGTKSTPAIDPSGAYIYAYALDGYIHKYNIATGAEVTGGGFPAQATLLPNNIEKGSSSINIANGYLYMAISANDGDYGHYDGHVIAINLSNGAKTIWNAECSNISALLSTSGSSYCANTGAGIWARPGVQIDPVTGNVFVATGNGNYNADSGGSNWGDSIIELKPNLSSVIDSYTPTDYSNMDSTDTDLGSTAPVILPTQSGSNTPYMLVQGGKDGNLRLLNRSNLSGQGGPRHTGGELQPNATVSNEMHEQPAVWKDSSGATWVFVTDESGDLYAYKIVTSGGKSSLSQVYEKSLGVPSSPFVANGVLYLDGSHLLALDAQTGNQLFSSSSVGVSLSPHWEAPTVVNGMVYTTDYSGNLYALYVPGVTPTSAPTASSSPAPSGSHGTTPTATGGHSPGAPSAGPATTGSPVNSKKSTAPGKANSNTVPQSVAAQAGTVASGPSNASTASPSLADRAKRPLFIASASGAAIATGVAIKLVMLKGVASANLLPYQTFGQVSLPYKIRLLLSKLLRRG